MDETMKLKKMQKTETLKTQEQQTMRSHLTELQKWDLTEGQTIEERRSLQRNTYLDQAKEINDTLRAKASQTFPEVTAERTADGTPIQAQQPAQLTFKQRMEQNRLDRYARRRTPLADHVSVHMMESLEEKKKMQDNALHLLSNEQMTQVTEGNVDTRVLRNFVSGFHTNKRGVPISPQDESRRNADQRFLEDYISKDIERRKPHLDRMLQQVLSSNLTEDKFTTAYLEHHLGEVKTQVDRLVYFENIYKDPVNAPYFDALPQLTKDLIQQRVFNRYGPMGYVLGHTCNLKAVNADLIEYMTNATEAADLEIFSEMIDQERQLLHNALEETASAEKEAVKREFAFRLDAEKKELLKESDKTKKEAPKANEAWGGLDLTSFVTGYSFEDLAKYREMIETHPVEYEQNSALIDALYQGMHHTIDIMGDLKLHAMASQAIMDEINVETRGNPLRMTVTQRLLMEEANLELKNASEKTDLLSTRLNAHADALQAFLRGKEFSAPAKLLLKQMGHPME